MKKLESQHLTSEGENQFEHWINVKVNEARSSAVRRKQTGPYKIPVVVHVIHNGEAIGMGTNISDAQILSQIKVLNDDFRRQNADAANTPNEFKPLAGSMDIEFVVAKRDPEGQATNGIVRVKGAKTSWTSNDNYEIKAQSYWPSENYLNLWVCDITDFLGYVQFPVSNLPGLENSSNNNVTDGVVIWYKSFGSIDDGNFDLDQDYNKGRTATHEVSHFFGLRHIWGDDDACAGTDYVDDTPNQGTYTTGCPAHPKTTCTPPIVSMFQNFQDYTDDPCMNLFTQGQIDRMQVVIENSPRRKSLLTSNGILPPAPVSNDLGIRELVSPPETQCSNLVIPSIELRNYGNNVVTSARLLLTVNGIVKEIKNVTLNLAVLDSVTINFNALTFDTGISTLTFEILLTNGVADKDAVSNKNIFSTTVFIPPTASLPIIETFTALSTDWTINNPDQQITWEITTATNRSSDNKALLLRFFDYENNTGEVDVFYSPLFDLSQAETAALFFDVSHAPFDFSNDELKIIVIKNCTDISEGIVVYEKSGSTLATVSPTTGYFVPNSASDWRREFIDLSSLVGEGFVQLAFVGINQYGNNLYLDNIIIATNLNDLSLDEIISPSLVTCNNNAAPIIQIQNTGTTFVESATVQFQVNGSASQTKTFTALNLQPGETTQLTLPMLALNQIENILRIDVIETNSQADGNSQNNVEEIKIIINQAKDIIPLRENFDKPFEEVWTIANPATGMNWQTIATNFNQSLYFNAYTNTDIGDESWVVSPVLDFSRLTEASMVFDLSYVSNDRKQENLKIMVSKNCGDTYQELGFTFPDVNSSAENWIPKTEEDWYTDRYVNLSSFAGNEAVRIAFVVTNANGNNVYIDNIEFFTSEAQRNIELETPYSIYGYDMGNMANSKLKIGFNLEDRQEVKIQIMNTIGELVAETEFADVLNQIYDLPSGEDFSAGVYIVRLNIGGKYYATKIFLGP